MPDLLQYFNPRKSRVAPCLAATGLAACLWLFLDRQPDSAYRYGRVGSASLFSLLFFTCCGVTAYFVRRYFYTRTIAVEATHSRLAAAMDSTLDAVFMYDVVRDSRGAITDFRFTYLNSAAEQMMGQSREYLVGRLVCDLFPSVRTSGRFDLYRKVAETGEPLVLEIDSVILNGGTKETRYVRARVVRIDDAMLYTCVDITAERLATQDLKRSLTFNRSIVDSSSFSIIVMDLDGIITSINPAAETMLGYTRDELIGKDITTLHDATELIDRARTLREAFDEPIPADSTVFRARLSHGLVEDSEWTYLCRNGLRLPVQVHVNAIQDEDGDTVAYMASSYDLIDRKQTDQYIYHIAHHDPLTGLPGRALLRESLNLAIEHADRDHTTFAVLMVDLDHFKRINDSLGHDTGDVLLREVAYRLRSIVRKADTVARLGADEFVILLHGVAGRTEAESVARKIGEAFRLPILIAGQQIDITASMGLSLYPDSPTGDDLLRHADIALHHGKSLGRSALSLFTPDLGKKLLDKLQMETALRTAIERNEFFLVYQPQISLTDHTLIGVEALIRWRSPDAGLILPSLFIPVAEETGLIVPIGAWCLETACREIAQLQRQLDQCLSVAVNLSPNQVHAANFQGTVERALALSGLDAQCLEVEITEGLLMRDSEDALQIIEGIQALGVTTAIDDFGTGFSNMSYITRFKVDRLKIDRSFVSRCLTDANSLAVTTAIIALAHSLNMEVVAEGVETAEQAAMLRSLECDSAQGYLYSPPRPIDEVLAFTRSLDARAHTLEAQNEWVHPHPSHPPTLEA
jgi:diguanylate cyclase (GGDEF)-like protein/PAS domain S-box-containing protein